MGVTSRSGGDWRHEHFKAGITKQIESKKKGEDYHYTSLSNAQLKERLERLLGREVTFNMRWRLVQELWKEEGILDYTPNPLTVRNAPVVSVYSASLFLSFLLSRQNISTSFKLFTFIRNRTQAFQLLPLLPSVELSEVM